MTEITVESAGGGAYRVTVTEGGSARAHEVTTSGVDLDGLGGGAAPEKVIEASFRFLLDREPKESILRNFDLAVIGRYFPEYPSKIADYL